MNPKNPIVQLVEELARLPGVGKRTARRLAFYIIEADIEETNNLVNSINLVKNTIKKCSICYNYTTNDICEICSDSSRDKSIICVVEKSTDIYAIEKGGHYKGIFHVLGGSISHIKGILPEDLSIESLIKRLREDVEEVILCTGTGTDGEQTSLYLSHILKDIGIKISRIARGLPAGAELEYADEITLLRAMEGRSIIK